MPTVRVSHKNLGAYVRDDVNIVAAGLLYDMAILQSSERSAFGYKRAGKVLATALDASLRDLVAAGMVREVPFLGPASERIIEELVAMGESATVTKAVANSPKRTDVEKRRKFRRAYLSRHSMMTALDARLGEIGRAHV